jgi:hypothetical protein
MKPAATEQPEAVTRLASALTGWTERWVPGTFICALLATGDIVITGWTATASTFSQLRAAAVRDDPGAVRHGGAHSFKIHLGWIVSTYDLGEALANLVHPFVMAAGPRDVAPQRTRRDGLHAAGFRRSYAGGFPPSDAAWDDTSVSATGSRLNRRQWAANEEGIRLNGLTLCRLSAKQEGFRERSLSAVPECAEVLVPVPLWYFGLRFNPKT